MSLPKPLSEFRAELREASVGLRLEDRLRVSEPEAVKLSTARGSTVDMTINRKVERIEVQREAHYLESVDGARIYVFATRGSASDYVQAQRSGKASLRAEVDAWESEKRENDRALIKARAERAVLEEAIMRAETRFMDSEDNLAFNKAKEDLGDLEDRIKALRLKGRPRPQASIGQAISIQFACEEILTRDQIKEAVSIERARLLKIYNGLPESSDLPLVRRAVLEIMWKR